MSPATLKHAEGFGSKSDVSRRAPIRLAVITTFQPALDNAMAVWRPMPDDTNFSRCEFLNDDYWETCGCASDNSRLLGCGRGHVRAPTRDFSASDDVIRFPTTH